MYTWYILIYKRFITSWLANNFNTSPTTAKCCVQRAVTVVCAIRASNSRLYKAKTIRVDDVHSVGSLKTFVILLQRKYTQSKKRATRIFVQNVDKCLPTYILSMLNCVVNMQRNVFPTINTLSLFIMFCKCSNFVVFSSSPTLSPSQQTTGIRLLTFASLIRQKAPHDLIILLFKC